MSNPLYSALNGAQNAPQSQGYNNPAQMLDALRRDPAGVLRSRGLNIPNGMNNPQEIINHLLSSGQVSNPRLQMAQQMVQRFIR